MQKGTMNKNPCRSDKYQYKLLELCCPQEWFYTMAEQEKQDPEQHDRYLDLRAELFKALKALMKRKLTPSQYIVIDLTLQGFTQIEIAKKLGRNQSSITKSMHGNVDYRQEKRNATGPKQYGGSFKKIRRLAAEDPKIQSILAQIQDNEEPIRLRAKHELRLVK